MKIKIDSISYFVFNIFISDKIALQNYLNSNKKIFH